MNAKLPILVLILTTILVAQVIKPVDVEQESRHRELLSNAAIRVWSLELRPHETTKMHRHRHEYLEIQIDEAYLSRTVYTDPPSMPAPRNYDAGEMWYYPPGSHVLKNESGSLRGWRLEIELLQRGPSDDYSRDLLNDAAQPKAFRPTLNPVANYNDKGNIYNVYLTRQQLLPGASGEAHEHKVPHLVVALTDLELRAEAEGKPPETLRMRKGEVVWVEKLGRHRLVNAGREPARFVTVEYR